MEPMNSEQIFGPKIFHRPKYFATVLIDKIIVCLRAFVTDPGIAASVRNTARGTRSRSAKRRTKKSCFFLKNLRISKLPGNRLKNLLSWRHLEAVRLALRCPDCPRYEVALQVRLEDRRPHGACCSISRKKVPPRTPPTCGTICWGQPRQAAPRSCWLRRWRCKI